MICNDFSRKFLPGCWPQYHQRSWHPSSCCGTACVSDKTPRPWRKQRSFFGVRRKTWRLGRFLSLSILHFAFFVGHGLFFYPNPAHVEPEHQTQQKNYHVFRSTVIRSHCQTFGFVKTFHLFSKKQKKHRKTAQLCKRHPQSLLIENGLVQDRNRLVCWATQSKTATRAPSKRKNSHGNWKIRGFCFLFGNEWRWHNMFDGRTSRNHLFSS